MNFLKYIDEKIEKLTPFYIYCVIFLLTLSIRLVAVVLFQKFLPMHSAFLSDSFAYLQQATAILKGHWITNGFPNGYPLIIALFSFLPNKELVLFILNVVLSSLVASFVSCIVYKRAGSKFAALVSGIIVALWYNQIIWSNTLLSEAPSAFFLVLGILLLMEKKEYSGGFAIGFASVIRTTLLPIGLLIALFYRSRKIFLGFLIPVVLMMGVGYYFTGSFSAGNYFGVNLYIASHILPNGQQDLVSVPSGISTSQGVKIYIGSMMENPLKFIYQRAQQLWLLWGFWANVNSHNFIMTVVFNALLGLRFPLLLLLLHFPQRFTPNTATLIPLSRC